MGRGARHIDGEAILYADNMTKSMKAAIEEIQRRRHIQVEYNLKNNITPEGINKPIKERLLKKKPQDTKKKKGESAQSGNITQPLEVQLTKTEKIDLNQIDPTAMTPDDKKKLAAKLRRRMLNAAKDMDFELAAILRDKISQL